MRRLPLDASLGALLVGCIAPDQLADVEIDAPPALEEVLRAELLAFEAAAGPGRVKVRRVVADPAIHARPDVDALGAWNPLTKRIRVDAGLAGAEAAQTLRHELCHALVTAEGPFTDAAPDRWERLGRELTSAAQRCSDPECFREEAFATYCGYGPWVAGVLASTCPSDEADLGPVMEVLGEEVWTGEPVVRAPDPQAPTATAFTGFTPTDGMAAETVEPGIIFLGYNSPEHGGADWFELWTGRLAEGGTYVNGFFVRGWDTASVPDDLELEEALPPTVRVYSDVGEVPGPGYVHFQVLLEPLGSPQRYVHVDREGEHWLLGDGCADGAEPFWADGGVFQLTPGTRSISWTALD